MPSPVRPNIVQEEKALEAALRDRITAIRQNSPSQPTTWDMGMSSLLHTALADLEFEKIHGTTIAGEHFERSMQNYVPTGHQFMILPIQFNHTDPDLIID